MNNDKRREKPSQHLFALSYISRKKFFFNSKYQSQRAENRNLFWQPPYRHRQNAPPLLSEPMREQCCACWWVCALF